MNIPGPVGAACPQAAGAGDTPRCIAQYRWRMPAVAFHLVRWSCQQSNCTLIAELACFAPAAGIHSGRWRDTFFARRGLWLLWLAAYSFAGTIGLTLSCATSCRLTVSRANGCKLVVSRLLVAGPQFLGLLVEACSFSGYYLQACMSSSHALLHPALTRKFRAKKCGRRQVFSVSSVNVGRCFCRR